MRFAIIYVFILISFASTAHEFNLARFDIRKENEQALLFVRLDKDNLLNAIEPYCDDYAEIGLCFEEYLRFHFAIEVNNEKVKFYHASHVFEDEMIELKFYLEHPLEEVKSIGIYNDTLLEEYNAQQNIVSTYLSEKKRTFRMDKDRIRIHIDYQEG